MDEALLLKVGKALDNDVVLNIPFISEYHLEIFRDVQGNVFMTDLNSSNGTFVNGNKLIPHAWRLRIEVLRTVQSDFKNVSR